MAGFTDTILVYHSAEDDCWIGHSLRTDQIGCAGSALEALAEAIRVIGIAIREARADNTLALERFAPKELWELAKKAQPFPPALVEIAREIAKGQFHDWKLDGGPNDEKALVVNQQEVGVC